MQAQDLLCTTRLNPIVLFRAVLTCQRGISPCRAKLLSAREERRNNAKPARRGEGGGCSLVTNGRVRAREGGSRWFLRDWSERHGGEPLFSLLLLLGLFPLASDLRVVGEEDPLVKF